MSDIATRYMRLVEKRPELRTGWEPRSVGGDSWTDGYDVLYCEDAHAIIFAKLVEKLRSPYFLQPEPDDAGWSVYYYEGNVPTPYSKAYEKPTPLEALLAFWEGQP